MEGDCEQFRQSVQSPQRARILPSFSSKGDYSTPVSAPLQWGIAHEDIALQAYGVQVERQVDPCGILISCDLPFLVASPDGVVFDDGNEMGLVEG